VFGTVKSVFPNYLLHKILYRYRENNIKTVFIASILLLLNSSLLMAVGLDLPDEKHAFAFPDTLKGLSISNFDAPSIFIPTYNYLKYDFIVDSTRSFVIGSNKLADPHFTKPLIFTLNDYKTLRYRSDIRNTFKKTFKDDLFTQVSRSFLMKKFIRVNLVKYSDILGIHSTYST